MRWSESQVAMLREMGIRVWPAEGDAVVEAEATAVIAHAPERRASASPEMRAPQAPAVDARVPGPRRIDTPTPDRQHIDALAAEAARALSPGTPATPATPDWSVLRDEVAACTACKLHEGRTQTVFGIGHPQAHWMIVGEAPGEAEDLSGEPFVGKSGQLLDNMLRAIGLTREAAGPERQVYIANTVKCRPPNNRNPQPDELARCEPFLVRQLQLVKPKIILAMGQFAVRSLLRSDEPVGRLRGRVHQYEGVPLIVTYHPAYLLRNLEDKARAWDDLCLALEVSKAPATA